MAHTPLRRRIAPSVPLTLDLREDGGELKLELRLSFDFNALVLVEEMTGKSMLDGAAWQNPSGATLSVLFWASLLAHQPEYEGKDGLAIVRSYMGPDNAVQITDAVMRAFTISLPPEQQEAILARTARPIEPAATPGGGPSTAGSTSGPSHDSTSSSPSANAAA